MTDPGPADLSDREVLTSLATADGAELYTLAAEAVRRGLASDPQRRARVLAPAAGAAIGPDGAVSATSGDEEASGTTTAQAPTLAWLLAQRGWEEGTWGGDGDDAVQRWYDATSGRATRVYVSDDPDDEVLVVAADAGSAVLFEVMVGGNVPVATQLDIVSAVAGRSGR